MHLSANRWCIQYFLDNSISRCSSGITSLVLMPHTHGRSNSSPLWIFSLNFTSRGGPKVWHHTVKSWCKINAHVPNFLPTRKEEILNLNLWWHGEYQHLKYHGQSNSHTQEKVSMHLQIFGMRRCKSSFHGISRHNFTTSLQLLTLQTSFIKRALWLPHA